MKKGIGCLAIVVVAAGAGLYFVDPRVTDMFAEPWVVRSFGRLYYNRPETTWKNTKFLGVDLWKNPMDLWVYQEMLYEQKPDLVIEAGTLFGGSAYYMARMMDLIGHGKIVTIDIEDRPGRPQHPRITYLLGSSTSPEIEAKVKAMIGPDDKVMVVLDSDHSKTHVLNELRLWGKYVKKGGYMIAEDTNINGHPVLPTFGPGPWEAVEEFLQGNQDFVVDSSKEKFMVSQNPRGYLKKVR